MRVGITGANGFTGRYLVAALAERGHHPVAIASDVGDAAALRDEIAGIAPDAVAHLAAIAFVHSDDYAGFYAVNQVGSLNLLEAVRRTKPGCRVLLASSAQVYGAGASGLIDEDHAVAPANHYAISKLAMELGTRLFSTDDGDGPRPVVVRPFNYTGRGQETRYLVPKIVDHFRRRASTIELGNIDVRRDFGDVRAVVEAYVRLLETPGAIGPLNVATGTAWSVREVVAIAERLTGHRIEVSVNPAFLRKGDVDLLAGDPGRLAAAIPGWTPRSIEDTIGWMLDEGATD